MTDAVPGSRASLMLFMLMVTLAVRAGDWPMLRGAADHTGLVAATDLKRPFRLVWAAEIPGERLGTAMEPIVAGDSVYVATHAGNVYCLNAASGEARWRFHTKGPVLQSPAFSDGLVLIASTDGFVYALSSDSGKVVWRRFVQRGGFAASPLVVSDRVFIGSRAGDCVALDLKTGVKLWSRSLAAPIRQTAAFANGKLLITAEDLKVRCFEAASGKLIWTSDQLSGQTARDYYPIVIQTGDRTLVVVRTNPTLNMGQRIGRDRTMLCRIAGVDDSSWQKLEAWVNSDASHGTPELWAKEQRAIIQYLETNRDAETFFVVDGATGKKALTAPVLWIGGCQGVGAEPALTGDGRLLVFYRSVYGNWNHGVAPLVTLGLYDLAKNKITPLFHQQGKKPGWNCFWGTADESQNFVVAGGTALIVHQGTLSGFDFKRNELFPIFGERDTYGGFRSPAWARNEWHGPGRSGVAVVGNRIYWQTGSRILCLQSGEQGKRASITSVTTAGFRTESNEAASRTDSRVLSAELTNLVEEIISKRWAPLFAEPGLAGRDFSFDDSSELFEALAWAFPHLPTELRARVKDRLGDEWVRHAPYTTAGLYSLKEGDPCEWFRVPDDYRVRSGGDKQPHPFGGVYAACLYGERCGEKERLVAAFPEIKTSFEAFEKTNWKLDPVKGDLFANRYLAALVAYSKLAGLMKDESAGRASVFANKTSEALVGWWRRATGTLTNFSGSAQLDPFITSGDAISFKVAPHRHKIALFQDLTPEVAAILKKNAPEAVEKVWGIFERLYCTWFIVGEERQVHFGENFIDPPDLALNAFKALVWLRKADRDLALKVDLPFCRADLYYATKLSLAVESETKH